MFNTAFRGTKRSRYILFGASLLVGPASQMCRAQALDSNAVAAQAVGTAFLKALQARDWKAAASFLDIVPLDHFRLEQIDMARRSRSGPGMTVEQYMKSDSTMPRAVAEYQVRRMREGSRTFSALEFEFGITDPDSLAAMPARVAAEHWLEAHDPLGRLKILYKRSNCPRGLPDSLPQPNFRVLGTVVNGAIAYLLYERDDEPPMDMNQLQSPLMVTLRRSIDQWWVLPRESSNGIAFGVTCSVVRKTK